MWSVLFQCSHSNIYSVPYFPPNPRETLIAILASNWDDRICTAEQWNLVKIWDGKWEQPHPLGPYLCRFPVRGLQYCNPATTL